MTKTSGNKGILINKRLTENDKKQIQKLYFENYTINGICCIIGFSYQTVAKYIKQSGLKGKRIIDTQKMRESKVLTMQLQYNSEKLKERNNDIIRRIDEINAQLEGTNVGFENRLRLTSERNELQARMMSFLNSMSQKAKTFKSNI